MKRIAILALALVIALGLCACRRGNDVTTTPSTTTAPTTQATIPTTTTITMPTMETNIPDPDINTTMPNVTLDPTFDTADIPNGTTGQNTTDDTSGTNARNK